MSDVLPPEKPVRKRRVSIARQPLRQRVAVVKGQDSGRFFDFYHGVLTASWPGFILQLAALFITVNLIPNYFAGAVAGAGLKSTFGAVEISFSLSTVKLAFSL